jgi:hypothetical protein
MKLRNKKDKILRAYPSVVMLSQIRTNKKEIVGGFSAGTYIQPNNFIVVDDGYRPKRRRLYDTQPSKGGLRNKYSEGNYKSIRKGAICNFGQICGGIKEKTIRTYDWNNKRLSKSYYKIDWLSHRN